MTVHLLLKPLDVWLFRDGRPFNREIDHRAASLFPPLPTVIQGAIRTHYIEQNGGLSAYLAGKLPEVERVVGKKGAPPPDSFRLSGPFVVREQDKRLIRYFPLPGHAYQDGNSYRLLKPSHREEIVTNLNTSLQLLWMQADPTKQADDEGGRWLPEQILQTLLTRQELPDDTDLIKGNTLFQREHRLGIDRLDESLSSEEGAIYQVEFIRPCPDMGLYVAIEGISDWPQSGILRLGGEGRLATYQTIDALDSLMAPTTTPEQFTLTFLTPTWFERGWQPANWSKFFAGSLKLVAVAVNRPMVMGGFDLAKQEQKPARRYVPAGSTYYFEGKTTIKETFICDSETDGRIGFGQFIIGEWSS